MRKNINTCFTKWKDQETLINLCWNQQLIIQTYYEHKSELSNSFKRTILGYISYEIWKRLQQGFEGDKSI